MFILQVLVFWFLGSAILSMLLLFGYGFSCFPYTSEKYDNDKARNMVISSIIICFILIVVPLVSILGTEEKRNNIYEQIKETE